MRDVMNDPALAILVGRHLKAAAAVMPPLPGLAADDYAAALADRFRNPAIAHETFQIAMDGTQKLPQRIFQPALAALEAGHDVRPFAFATAMWMRYCLGQSEDGERYPLRDPREAEIHAVLAGAFRTGAAISAALHSVLGLIHANLVTNIRWRTSVEQVLDSVLLNGVVETIRREAVRGKEH